MVIASITPSPKDCVYHLFHGLTRGIVSYASECHLLVARFVIFHSIVLRESHGFLVSLVCLPFPSSNFPSVSYFHQPQGRCPLLEKFKAANIDFENLRRGDCGSLMCLGGAYRRIPWNQLVVGASTCFPNGRQEINVWLNIYLRVWDQ